MQEAATGEVLMLAYMNLGALQRTADTGTTWFWSRSRREYWNKGATSGHVQRVVSMSGDCDGDALLHSGGADGCRLPYRGAQLLF